MAFTTGYFERLTPPWESVRVIDRRQGLADGSQMILEVGKQPLRVRWVAEHRLAEGISDHSGVPLCSYVFQDVQTRGRFHFWSHTHRLTSGSNPGSCWLEGEIEYILPLRGFGDWLARDQVHSRLRRLFQHRHEVTLQDLRLLSFSKGGRSMRILITGSTGLVGSALVPFLTAGNNTVTHLVRAQSKHASLGSTFVWDPSRGELNKKALEGADAIIHLAGENIASGRWNSRRKTKIKESRLTSTRLLAESLSQMPTPPRVFISASAIGYYGDRGEEKLDESSSPGSGFLADVCREWEEQTAQAASRGIRVVNLRIGIVLSPKGGALAKMLTPFRLGLGGVLGDGHQFMSWISIDDLVGVIYYALITESLQGPVNAVTPHPVTNRDFTQILGSVLHRPTVAAVPAFVARLAFGEMADALLLSSAKVMPRRLLDGRYQFRYADLESALKHLLGK